MPNFMATRDAPAYEKADDSSKQLGKLNKGQIIYGVIEDDFVKTQIDAISSNPIFFDPLEDVQEISLAPEPIATEDLGIFCAIVTKAARACGTDRDYLMAVAYSGTKKLQDLGQEGAKRVGPFQFTEEEWKEAITTGPAKNMDLFPEERFQWSSQPEVAALLAAERTARLKADTALGRDPTFAELYFAQLFGPDADKILKQPRTDICPAPAEGTHAADLALISGDITIEAVLTGLQTRLAEGYAEALKVIEGQPPEIRIFRPEEQGDPPWLAVAKNEMTRGVSENRDRRNSNEIKEYFKVTDFQGNASTAAWCGAFATFCMKKSGVPEVENSIDRPGSALAAWWRKWGQPAADPHRIGTVVVLEANANRSGHVGFLVGEGDGKVQLLAGNQGGHGGPDHVGVVPYKVEEVVERRWLEMAPLPAAVGGLNPRTLLHKGVNAGPGDRLFVEKAPVVMRKLIAAFPELTIERAAAILGNIGHECAGFTQFEQLGGGGGRGWCQWDGSRREAFFAFADKNGFPHESDDANYGYLTHELKETSEGQVLRAMKKATTLEAAVKIFNDVFERSGKPALPSRNRYSVLALEAF